MGVVLHRQFQKAAELLHRHPDKGIFLLGLLGVVVPAGQLHRQVDGVVRLISQALGLRQPDGIGEPRQAVPEVLADEGLLALVQLPFADDADFLVRQFFRQLLHHPLVFMVIARVQPVDFLDGPAGLVALRLHLFHVALGNARQRGHPDAEKLIQIIAVNAHEAQPFQQRHGGILCFLQDPVIEIHPAYVPRNDI